MASFVPSSSRVVILLLTALSGVWTLDFGRNPIWQLDSDDFLHSESKHENNAIALAAVKQVCEPNASDAQIGRFCGWLQQTCEAGGLANVFFGGFQHGEATIRGLGASKNFTAGDLIFCIPKKCWMHQGGVPDRIRDMVARCDGSGLEMVAFHIAMEKQLGNGSFWAPFLSLLPGHFAMSRFHPAYVENDIRFHDDINHWPRKTFPLMRCFGEYLESGGFIHPSEVYWAFVQLLQRRFDKHTVVPLADVMNTAPAPEQNVNSFRPVAWDDTEVACVGAKKNISEGDELFTDYRAEQRSAMGFFADYGFALAPEVHDNREETGDGCAGIRSHEFQEPDPDRFPVLHNYWRFSQMHCNDRQAEL